MHESSTQSMQPWLDTVRQLFVANAPDLTPLFNTYAAEALFGRSYIDIELRQLPKAARILEIGAGSLLLSCQLVREGFRVTALEPIGEGFSHFNRMRALVLEAAKSSNCHPHTINTSAESLNEIDCFDFAFSVNVMEHVTDFGLVIKKVGRSLTADACYRFTCPNYLFPYEPHFNIATLFSKKLTRTFMRKKISGCRHLEDPEATWRSLNWINVLDLQKVMKAQPSLSITFNRRMLASTLERVVFDPAFATRRSPKVQTLITRLVRWRLHRALILLPAMMQPILDCRIHRIATEAS